MAQFNAKAMTKAQREHFFATLHAANPHPKTELYYTNPYTLLVAVTLSAQATDKGVNKATASLFQAVQTPQQMLEYGEDALREAVKSIGLYKTKAANIYKAARVLVEEHGGEVPNDQNALEALAGVGRKTANVVRNCAFGEPTMAVDTHIFRVSNRTGLAAGKNVLAVEQALLKRVPKPYMQHAHHWLILLGRYTCVAQRPKCSACPVVAVCQAKDKNI